MPNSRMVDRNFSRKAPLTPAGQAGIQLAQGKDWTGTELGVGRGRQRTLGVRPQVYTQEKENDHSNNGNYPVMEKTASKGDETLTSGGVQAKQGVLILLLF